MDRFIDPTWVGHETAGRLFAELLRELSGRGRVSFDASEAATELARAFEAHPDGAPIAAALRAVAEPAQRVKLAPGAGFYQRLRLPGGLPGRPWYTNALWAPGRETGYAAVLLPTVVGAPEAEARAAAAAALAEHIRSALGRDG